MTLKTLDSRSLSKLAQKAGLSIDESDLQQLVKRRIVTTTEDDSFVAAHLFILALYEDSVRVVRHPWGPRTAEISLDDVRGANKRLERVLTDPNPEDAGDFVLEMERYLAKLDPFGPFAAVVDMLGPEAGEAFRGAGRLYVELRRTATTLATIAEAQDDDTPSTQQVPYEDDVDDPRATADLSQADVLAGLHASSDVSDDPADDELAEQSDGATEEGASSDEPLEEADEVEVAEADDDQAVVVDTTMDDDEAGQDESSEPELDEASEPSEPELDEASEPSEPELDEASEPSEPELDEADEPSAPEAVPANDEVTAVGVSAFAETASETPDISEASDASETAEDSEPSDDAPPPIDPEDFVTTTEMEAASRETPQQGVDEIPSDAGDTPSINNRDTPQVPLDAVGKDGNESLRDRLARLRNTSSSPAPPSPAPPQPATSNQDTSTERMETPARSVPAVDAEKTSASAPAPGSPPPRPTPPSPPPQADTPEQIAAKVDELNRLREQYIAEHNWEGLAELYEDRINLFETPAERQQIYLTLATVYDVKLKRPEQAMASYAAAIGEGADAGMKRALDGLDKVGRRDGNREAYLEWLESAVGSDELATHRTALRVRLANTLGALGQHQRAFMTLAAVATEHPAEVISVDSLDQLDEWAAHADMEDELDALFDDVIDEEMPDDSLRLVAQRAGLHHVAKNQAMRAIRFFRIVLDVQPDNEMAYGNLSRLYEDEQNWADLVRLIERKIAATDEDDERERLQNQLADAVEKELASEDAIETYAELVESHPDNPIYADRLVRAHLLRDQHAEAYGLLNRFVDSALNDDQTVNIHLRLAEIAANHLHAPEEALVHYQDALAVKSDPRALMGVANLKYEAGDWAGVVTTIDALMAHNDALHFEERIAWLEKGIAAAERTQDDDAMQRFIAGMNQFDV